MTSSHSDEYAQVCELMPAATDALESVLPSGVIVVLHLHIPDGEGKLHGHYASNAPVVTAMKAMQDTMENLTVRD